MMPAADRPLRTVVLYSADPWDSALPVLRVRGPAEVMGVTVVQGNTGADVAPERVSQADLVIVQRDFPRFDGAWEAVAARARAEDKPVVYELDDLLLELPPGHAMERAYSDVLFSVLRAVLEADAVVASTPALAAYLEPFNPQVQVLPNCLDDRLWPLAAPAGSVDPAAPVVIGYMGGQTHLPDLLEITPSLLRVLDRYGGRVRLQFWGGQPPPALLARANVTWTELNLLNYAEFAGYFARQTCDIAVAPLRDNLFNRCKSSIKFLEYSALGVPGIYSRLEPYGMIIKPNSNGLLASSPEEWEQALGSLIESADLRRSLAEGAQATLRQGWLLSSQAPHWLNRYQQLAQVGRRSVLAEPHRRVLARAAALVQARHRELEEQVAAIGQQAAAQTAEALRLSHQLDEIQRSAAWRLASAISGLRFRLAPRGSRRERLLDNLLAADRARPKL